MMVAHHRLVAILREAKGWSQANLADEADLSQGFISKVESGLLPLSGDSLTKVADALSCPVDVLTDDTPFQGLEVTCLHHRRRHSKIPAATKRRIEALTHLTRVSVEGLLRGIELIPEEGLRRIDPAEAGGPAAVAAAMRAAWRVPSGPIPNLVQLLESVGVVVVVRDLSTAAQDAVTTWPHDQDRPPIMVVNASQPGDKQRFTLSHETGHLIMHPIPTEEQEDEANEFAGEFLAPAADIDAQLSGLTTRDFPRLMQLKAEWGMSMAALIRRAKDLDRISDRQYREFQVKLRKMGWHINEPGSVPVETPATLERVMSVHLADHDYSVSELASAARMSETPFRKHYRPPVEEPRTPLRLVGDR